MKILCTTDFSKASMNAIEWVFNMLKEVGYGEIEIVHCVDTLRRADIFLAIDDLIKEKAVEDMSTIEKKYFDLDDKIKVRTSVHKAYTKTFLPKYAEQKNFDLIVTGTTGLTSLKDFAVGSVTDHISKHSEIPLLTIPPNSRFNGITNVVIGVGKEELESAKSLTNLHNLLEPHYPRIFLIQVLKKDRHTLSVDLRIEENLKELKYEYMTLEKDVSVNNTINAFCNKVNADLLCMVHYKRSWIESLVHKSITKEELFTIEKPLLIIPD